MNIACPKCTFSKSVDESKVPVAKKFIATCPKCATRFPVSRFTDVKQASNYGAMLFSEETRAIYDSTAADNNRPAGRHLKIVNNETDIIHTESRDEKEETAEAQAPQEALAGSHGSDENEKDECCGNCSGECHDSVNETGEDGLKSEILMNNSPDTAPSVTTPVDTTVGSQTGLPENSHDKTSKKRTDTAENPPNTPLENSSVVDNRSVLLNETPGVPKKSPKEQRTDPVSGTEGGKTGNSTTDSDSTDNGPRNLSFHGTGRTLFGIYLVNMLLSIATLGIYHFWGKAKVRRYLYSGSSFMNERFKYTGTGRELFMGKVRASAILFVLFVPPNLLSSMIHPALILLATPVSIVLLPIALTLTTRYRMSRSNLRGIQFSFRGSINDAIKLYIVGILKTIITLGFYYPTFYIDRQLFWRSNTWYGATPFDYNGETKDIKKTIIVGSLLTLLTFGLYSFRLSAELARYNWAHTTYKGLSFRFTATGTDIFKYQIVNMLLIIFTLGLGMAWVQKRKLDFNFKHLKIEGDIDFKEVEQSAQQAGATGESLATGLDMDFAI